MKKTALTGFIFLSIIYLQVCLISIFTHTLPSEIEFSVLSNLIFFTDLVQLNSAAAFRFLFIEQEIILIQKYELNSSSQIWGLYLMPVSIFTQLIISVIITKIIYRKPSLKSVLLSGISCFILFIAVFYLRLQSCCTSRPLWLPEVWLLYQTYSPLSDTAFWQNLYIEIQAQLPFIQYLLYALSLIILTVNFHHTMFNKQS